MALIQRDQLTTLLPASDVTEVAKTAEIELNKQAIAAAINNAANTGEMSVTVNTILPAVETELLSNGYTVQDAGRIHSDDQKLISWGYSESTNSN